MLQSLCQLMLASLRAINRFSFRPMGPKPPLCIASVLTLIERALQRLTLCPKPSQQTFQSLKCGRLVLVGTIDRKGTSKEVYIKIIEDGQRYQSVPHLVAFPHFLLQHQKMKNIQCIPAWQTYKFPTYPMWYLWRFHMPYINPHIVRIFQPATRNKFQLKLQPRYVMKVTKAGGKQGAKQEMTKGLKEVMKGLKEVTKGVKEVTKGVKEVKKGVKEVKKAAEILGKEKRD